MVSVASCSLSDLVGGIESPYLRRVEPKRVAPIRREQKVPVFIVSVAAPKIVLPRFKVVDDGALCDLPACFVEEVKNRIDVRL